ncbi:unnamed protein product [Auanema sp. JU1783]|nr:unnamed protein product [Auanema sp. JU1783]
MNSDLSDVEVECSFHLKQTVDFTNIKIQTMMQLLDLPEGRTCHSPAKRDEKYENKESQTTFGQNESRDSSTMTETVRYQNFCGMADIIASDRMSIHQNVEHFPETAFDAILWMLSIVIYRRQIEIMLNECSIDQLQILKSLKSGSRKIYKAIFNETKVFHKKE